MIRAPTLRVTPLARFLTLTVLMAACGPTVWHPSTSGPEEIPTQVESPFLKVHLHSGEVAVLREWNPALSSDSRLTGTGTLYDRDRRVVKAGLHLIPTDSIALLEANRPETVSELAVAGLVTWTAITGVTTALCLADPKSCFGSCPTFYLSPDDQGAPVAEGFSSSFARALQARDLDALHAVRPGGSRFSIHMRNEAWETHAVRSVGLRAAPVEPGTRILQTSDGELLPALRFVPPVACSSVTGDCTGSLTTRDGVELSIWTDTTDLARRTDVVLSFPAVQGPVGVVLSARHSFVSTFVFYQSLAFAGEGAGALLAALERGAPGARERVLGPARTLGPIEVHVSEGGGVWRKVGEFGEAGPIATDRIVFPYEATGAGQTQVRLRMAQGSWRVDELGLTTLGAPVEAVEVPASAVLRAGRADATAFERLADPHQSLVTTRGDHYEIVFDLPEDAERYQLFLESEGYYYEWMRSEWLVEEDPGMTVLLLSNPREGLRRLAPAFKRVERTMEEAFWASRFRR